MNLILNLWYDAIVAERYPSFSEHVMTRASLCWLIAILGMAVAPSLVLAKDKAEIAAMEKLGARVWTLPPEAGNHVHLTVHDNKKADEIVAVINEIAPRIQKVDFRGSSLTDAGLKALMKCENLRDLIIENTLVTDQGAEELAKFPYLDHFLIAGSKITNKGVAKIVTFPRLSSLSISRPDLATLKLIATTKRLVRLDIYDGTFTPEMTDVLATVPTLSGVIFVRCTFPDESLANLKKSETLVAYTFEDTKLTPKDMNLIKENKKLIALGFKNCGVVITDGEGFPALRSLTLTGSPVDLDHARQLGKIKSLGYLTLNDTTIDDRGVAELKTLSGLGQLELDGTKITDEGLVHFQEMKHIRYLMLRRTAVTQPAAQKLKSSLQQTYIILK